MDRALISAYAVVCEANCHLRADALERGDIAHAVVCDERAAYFSEAAFRAATAGVGA